MIGQRSNQFEWDACSEHEGGETVAAVEALVETEQLHLQGGGKAAVAASLVVDLAQAFGVRCGDL